MTEAILIHGKPSREKFESPGTPKPSESNWLPWAKRELEVRGIRVATPDMPVPYQPIYAAWASVLGRYNPGVGTGLVGLSAGAGFITEWMSRKPDMVVDTVALVAPWIDPNNRYPGFFDDVEIDETIPERCLGGMVIFYSSRDDAEALQSFEILHEKLPGAKVIDIPEYGHYMLGNTMQTERFPELIDEII